MFSTDLSYRFAGKLLLKKEIALSEDVFQKHVSAGNFTSIPSIRRNFFGCQCNRCGNRETALFAKIPCQICHSEHFYCRKCIEMGRVMECEPLYYWNGDQPVWPALYDPCSWQEELTISQQHAADRITEAMNKKEKEILVWAVCGAGKTEMLFPGITNVLQSGKRVCIATPRADVVRELLPRLRDAFAGTSIQGLYGGSEEKDKPAQLIIATTHQLLRFRHAFDVLIIDEVDAFPYHADPALPFATNRARKPSSTTIYLTATPRKKQRLQMATHKLSNVFVPVRFHGFPLPVPTMKLCRSLKKELAASRPPKELMKWLDHRSNAKRQLLLFVPTIALAEQLTGELNKRMHALGWPTDKPISFVHAVDPDREKKVEQFRRQEIFMLLTTTILERGVTFPSVDVVILDAGHVVFDEAALVQIAGRAGRSPDDPTGEVLFLHDGKTNAMIEAVRSIVAMNKRGGFQ
ncbi:DEAD/DEAH box helicase [Lentibacillus sp. N15]|uniref:DEAD/DEAH box helicase n=1 Tax=Lentibacillus songyuanensis TaxID=3136161 RepID=UPI0031BA6B71